MADHLYYIKLTYKWFSFKALIDSGAQISVISPHMATYLGLKSDHRKQGIVKGVGQAVILGSIPNCNFIINPSLSIIINLKVIQSNVDPYVIILGLDFLEKYKCVLNCITKKICIDRHFINFLTPKEMMKLPIDKRKIKNKLVNNK